MFRPPTHQVALKPRILYPSLTVSTRLSIFTDIENILALAENGTIDYAPYLSSVYGEVPFTRMS